MLSIIIPTFNEEKYITNLLDSILIQSYKNYEIIIIDANSDDNTIRAVDDFVKKNVERLRYRQIRIRKVDYRNTARQKNLGHKIAYGSILLFIDADMVIPDENFLYRMMKKLEKKRYAGATCKILIDERNIKNMIASECFNFIIFSLNLIGMNTARGGVQFIKRKYFDKAGGFNEEMYVAEDVDLSRRLIRYGKFYFDTKSFVVESDRRYRKEGYFRIISKWTINGIWTFFFKRSFHKRWKAVR